MLAFSIGNFGTVYAYEWDSEYDGTASVTFDYWWSAPSTIAEYTPHKLQLGAECTVVPQACWATAEGSMWVNGFATSSGWVTGTIHWFQKGNLAGTGRKWIKIWFRALDITDGALVEKVVMDKSGVWSDDGTWHTEYMDIALWEGHQYKFSIDVEVHADTGALGLQQAIADFGGLLGGGWSDGRIEWGYINVPNIVVPSYTLTISAETGGTTDPSPGTYVYAEGTLVEVEADAYSDWEFYYWILDGETNDDNPIDVTMSSDHTLTAYFVPEEITGGGCPILSVWNGTDYYAEGLLDIHNPEGIDLITNHTLVSTPQRVDGVFLMRLTEHPKTQSYIDQVKLFAVLEDGATIELPLIWAKHSEYGNVLPQLLFNDEWKTDTLGAELNNGTSQSIDLKFAALSPHLKIVAFTFQVEGVNHGHHKK